MATGLRGVTAMAVRMAATVLLAALALSASAQTVRYIHTDSLGSVAVVTDQNRNVLERREYEPYGLQLTPAIKDGPGYTGHVQDATTGLTYMQQRYYDAQIGRFLSVDPVTAGSVPGANFNRYWYGSNNPYKFSDPDGRQSIIRQMFGRLFPVTHNSGQSGVNDLDGSNDGDIDGDGNADGKGQDADVPPKTETDHAIDRIKFMKPPVAGLAGDRGELAGEGGEEGAERDYESLRGVPGAKSKWTSLGKELIYLPDGRIADKHKSTRPYKDGPPENTPTIKIYKPGGGSVPEVTIRYPER